MKKLIAFLFVTSVVAFGCSPAPEVVTPENKTNIGGDGKKTGGPAETDGGTKPDAPVTK